MTTSTPGSGPTPRRPWWRQHWLRHLVGLALVLGVLMVIARPVQVTPAPASRLVVVGVGERGALTATDRELLDSRADSAAYGVVATNRNIGECVSAAWLSLGAGRQAHTGEECEIRLALAPETRLGQEGGAAIANWSRLEAMADPFELGLGLSDARVADATSPEGDRCIAAVGPGAALAAADAEGAVARYSGLESWRQRGYPTECRVTIVDASASSDGVVRRLVEDGRATVLVIGLGPSGPLQRDAFGVARADKVRLSAVQSAYRIDPEASGAAGALSSATTREPGVVTLPDVSAAIVHALDPPSEQASALDALDTIDAAPLGVVPGPVSATQAEELLRVVSVLQDRRPILLTFGAVMVALLVVAGLMVVRRAWRHAALVGAALTTWPVALLAAGMVPWYEAGRPVLAGIGVVLGAWALMTALARVLATPRRPAGIAGASLTLAVTAASAAQGDAWQWGTLLDSTTALGPDWTGVGPAAAGICVASAFSIAAWWADRLPKRQSVIAIVGLLVLVAIVLLPNLTYVVALVAGGVVLTFADTARSWVRAAIPWADPLFSGDAAATLVAALVGTTLLLVDSGTILLSSTPEPPIFGAMMMGWLAGMTLALWMQLRAGEWFAARDLGLPHDPAML